MKFAIFGIHGFIGLGQAKKVGKMNLTDALEFFGMMTSMIGAYLMSRDHSKNKSALTHAFYFYLMSNTVMMYVAVVHGIGPLFIQMIFFALAGVEVLSSRISNRVRWGYAVLLSYIGLLYFHFNGFKFEITAIEVIAATMAVIGNYLFKYKHRAALLSAFALFFVADIIYVYVACDRSMWFFMGQSAFFLYSSIAGTLNILRAKPEDAVVKIEERDFARLAEAIDNPSDLNPHLIEQRKRFLGSRIA